jgi:hypothetical protein
VQQPEIGEVLDHRLNHSIGQLIRLITPMRRARPVCRLSGHRRGCRHTCRLR